MADEEGRIAVGIALRQARNRLSGSAMMEIVVCGGVPPYSYLLSGKLVCLMMLSPEVTQIYEERYSQQVSIIASQMAKRITSIRLPICSTKADWAALVFTFLSRVARIIILRDKPISSNSPAAKSFFGSPFPTIFHFSDMNNSAFSCPNIAIMGAQAFCR